VARAEAPCTSDTTTIARNGACFGDYINLDINLQLNAQQGLGLIAALLSMGGVALPTSSALTSATSEKPAASSKATSDDASDGSDAGDAVSDVTGKVTDLLPKKSDTQSEDKKSGGLVCGLLNLCRTTVGSPPVDVEGLLLGPVVAK
jgi:hypothetical protein